MRCQISSFKFGLECVLIIALIFLTYLRWSKLLLEETSLSLSYQDKGIEFPSLTICFRAYNDFSKAPIMNENSTFEDFMKSSKSVKTILNKAEFKYYGAIDKKRQLFDFLDKGFEDRLDEMCYLVANGNFYGLNRCLTLNSPIIEKEPFKEASVGFFH